MYVCVWVREMKGRGKRRRDFGEVEKGKEVYDWHFRTPGD